MEYGLNVFMYISHPIRADQSRNIQLTTYTMKQVVLMIIGRNLNLACVPNWNLIGIT